MTSPPAPVPPDPLERYLALRREVFARRMWSSPATTLRYAALGLILAQGEPHELAERLFLEAEELRRCDVRSLRQPMRFIFASSGIVHGDAPREIAARVGRVQGLFRRERIGRGGSFEALAAIILAEHATGGLVAPEAVSRFATILRELKRQHRFLTGIDDYPFCALLTTASDSPQSIAARVERFYTGLHERGFGRGSALQTTSQLLYFHTEPEATALNRAREIYAEFRRAGLYMSSVDYVVTGVLSYLDHDPKRIVERVLKDRGVLRKEKHRPGRQESFLIACNTAFLALASFDRNQQRVVDASRLARIQTLLQAQQAATAAAAGAAAAAAAAG